MWWLSTRGSGCDSSGERGRGHGDFKKCTHCGLLNQTIGMCWDIHRKFAWANQTSETDNGPNQNHARSSHGEEIVKLSKGRLC